MNRKEILDGEDGNREAVEDAAKVLKDKVVLEFLGADHASVVKEVRKKHTLPLDIEYLSDLSDEEDEKKKK